MQLEVTYEAYPTKERTISIRMCDKDKLNKDKGFEDAGKTSGLRKKPVVDRLGPTLHYYHQQRAMPSMLQ